ncbi:MAG: DedA family protein, partial [Rhodobacterales bacterium]|nr:DedA family protein [Rhodobacterales bacterium]
SFELFKQQFNAQGHWAVLIAGLTPFPYKVITITAGLTGMSFATFMLWSMIARATIFFVIAGLLWKFGYPIREFIEKRLGLMFTLFCIILVLGFIMVKVL